MCLNGKSAQPETHFFSTSLAAKFSLSITGGALAVVPQLPALPPAFLPLPWGHRQPLAPRPPALHHPSTHPTPCWGPLWTTTEAGLVLIAQVMGESGGLFSLLALSRAEPH